MALAEVFSIPTTSSLVEDCMNCEKSCPAGTFAQWSKEAVDCGGQLNTPDIVNFVTASMAAQLTEVSVISHDDRAVAIDEVFDEHCEKFADNAPGVPFDRDVIEMVGKSAVQCLARRSYS